MSPYPGIELCSLYEYLQQGSRLNQPPECPKALYALMKRCWQWLPRDRPSFAEINKQLASLLDEVRQELDGSQGVPQSPEKLLDNFTVTTKGAISSMEISSGAVSDDSFEGQFQYILHIPSISWCVREAERCVLKKPQKFLVL